MSNIHPFELYKMFISIRTHFTTLKFVYNYNMINVKYENFYKTRNHTYFETLSNKFSREHAEKRFVSNFVDNIDTSIHMIGGTESYNKMKLWQERIMNIDSVFEKNVNKLFNYYDIRNTHDFYMKMLDVLNYEKPNNKIESISDIKKKPLNADNFYSDIVFNYAPEVLIILNHLYYKKYDFDFIRACIDKKIEPVREYIKLYKYNYFIDADTLIKKKKYKKINIFYDNM